MSHEEAPHHRAPASRDQQIDALVERLSLAAIDIEVGRCDPEALRLTARDMIELATLLDSDEN